MAEHGQALKQSLLGDQDSSLARANLSAMPIALVSFRGDVLRHHPLFIDDRPFQPFPSSSPRGQSAPLLPPSPFRMIPLGSQVRE